MISTVATILNSQLRELIHTVADMAYSPYVKCTSSTGSRSFAALMQVVHTNAHSVLCEGMGRIPTRMSFSAELSSQSQPVEAIRDAPLLWQKASSIV